MLICLEISILITYFKQHNENITMQLGAILYNFVLGNTQSIFASVLAVCDGNVDSGPF